MWITKCCKTYNALYCFLNCTQNIRNVDMSHAKSMILELWTEPNPQNANDTIGINIEIVNVLRYLFNDFIFTWYEKPQYCFYIFSLIVLFPLEFLYFWRHGPPNHIISNDNAKPRTNEWPEQVSDWLTDWAHLTCFCATAVSAGCCEPVLVWNSPCGHFNVCWVSEWVSVWVTDWVTDWLTDWLTDWTNWTDWMTDRLTDWLTDRLTDWLIDCLNEHVQTIFFDTFWMWWNSVR